MSRVVSHRYGVARPAHREVSGEPVPEVVPYLEWLRRGLAAAFVVTLILTFRLWLSSRGIPYTPIIEGLPQVPVPLDYLLYGAMIAALIGTGFLRDPRWPIRVVLAIGTVWLILDQARWQPYFIQFLVFIAALSPIAWKSPATWRRDQVAWWVMPIRLLMACTYFYSGLQKLNHEFITREVPFLLGPVFDATGVRAGDVGTTAFLVIGLSMALTELVAGILLLVPRARKGASIVLVAMHTIILLLLGPIGRSWNMQVWPWNVAMITVLVLLFWKWPSKVEPGPDLFRSEWWRSLGRRERAAVPAPRLSLGVACVFVAFGVLPALNFFGLWDSYLSFALYAANTKEAVIIVPPEEKARFPKSLQSVMSDKGVVIQRDWSIEDCGAFPYPEERVALSIARQLATQTDRGDVKVVIAERPDIFTGARKKRWFICPRGGAPETEVAIDTDSQSANRSSE